jgi:hypothetical protein
MSQAQLVRDGDVYSDVFTLSRTPGRDMEVNMFDSIPSTQPSIFNVVGSAIFKQTMETEVNIDHKKAFVGFNDMGSNSEGPPPARDTMGNHH